MKKKTILVIEFHLPVSAPSYFKARWPDPSVPIGEPKWMFYEVDVSNDVVLRIIDVFDDGTAICDSIKNAEKADNDYRDPKYRSLVHGPFLSVVAERLEKTSKQKFEQIWAQSKYKKY